MKTHPLSSHIWESVGMTKGEMVDSVKCVCVSSHLKLEQLLIQEVLASHSKTQVSMDDARCTQNTCGTNSSVDDDCEGRSENKTFYYVNGFFNVRERSRRVPTRQNPPTRLTEGVLSLFITFAYVKKPELRAPTIQAMLDVREYKTYCVVHIQHPQTDEWIECNGNEEDWERGTRAEKTCKRLRRVRRMENHENF